MMRWTWIWLAAAVCNPGGVLAQDSTPRRQDAMLQDVQRGAWRRGVVHYGKWVSAGTAVAFTVMAAREHERSRRDWDALLAICRSADDACLLGPDGRYLRGDAEARYRRSLYYDARANRRLLGAQATLLVTAALFILDLRSSRGEPENIPFAPLRVTASPAEARVEVGLRFAF
jgi:hypothetical protein